MKIVIVDSIEDLVKKKEDLLLFRCPFCKKIVIDPDGHWEECEKDPLGLRI